MFSIGFIELLMIAVVALLVLGPERLPGAVRETAIWIGRVRRHANAIRHQIEEQIEDLENETMISDLKEGRKLLDEMQSGVKKDLDIAIGQDKSGSGDTGKSASGESRQS